MIDKNDHSLKRIINKNQEDDVKILKIVKLGTKDDYESPSVNNIDELKKIKTASTLTCGCHSVDCNTCGCHDVCVSNCTCDSNTICTCDSICTCDTVASHYWYPN